MPQFVTSLTFGRWGGDRFVPVEGKKGHLEGGPFRWVGSGGWLCGDQLPDPDCLETQDLDDRREAKRDRYQVDGNAYPAYGF